MCFFNIFLFLVNNISISAYSNVIICGQNKVEHRILGGGRGVEINRNFSKPRYQKKLDLNHRRGGGVVTPPCLPCVRWNRKVWLLITIFANSFSFSPKKRGKRKGEWSNKNRDQKSYLSVPSCVRHWPLKIYAYQF